MMHNKQWHSTEIASISMQQKKADKCPTTQLNRDICATGYQVKELFVRHCILHFVHFYSKHLHCGHIHGQSNSPEHLFLCWWGNSRRLAGLKLHAQINIAQGTISMGGGYNLKVSLTNKKTHDAKLCSELITGIPDVRVLQPFPEG